MKILILCTGNSCRSQMAEAFLKSFDPTMEVYSAGTSPAADVHPRTIAVMKEIGLDLSGAVPKNVDQFLHTEFDYVITVCDRARESCPVFTGRSMRRIHIGFDDPASATGNDDAILESFRSVRNEIRKDLFEFYRNNCRK